MNVHSYDCDNFTKEFYRIYFGIEYFTSIQVAQPPPPAVKQVSIDIGYTADSLAMYLQLFRACKMKVTNAKPHSI